MTLHPGQTLLQYRIVDKLGEGGMGEVWKALDTTLDREVAIKVLPEVFSQDPERLARFEREAKLLASLNHPNIATVHGLHEADPSTGSGQGGLRLLAMEMADGEDLASRLSRGPLPVDEMLAVAVQVAAALEAAHSKGVVHRDLKPANVVLTHEGQAKVLDFGLAKAVEPDAASASGSLSLSPTMTSGGTVAGMILGTAAYMSPEQARGMPVDRRTDLWSFGCLMFECLTGEQLFRGETASDSMAAILSNEPDWTLLPEDTPPLVRLLLRRCLTRDPAQRLQDAGDARIELQLAIEDPRADSLGLAPVEASVAARRRDRGVARIPWALAAAATLLAAYFALRPPASTLEGTDTRHLMIPIPGSTVFGDGHGSPPAVSPDGRLVVFGANEGFGEYRLWLRALNDSVARPLADTEGAEWAFWSPDSRHVGFFRGGKLRRIELATGRVRPIGGAGSTYPRGGSWNANGQIIFAPNSNAGIHVIDAEGGEPRQLTTPDPDVPDSSHRWPWFLPDGDHFLYVLWTNDSQARESHGGVYLTSLSGGEKPVRIVPDASSVAYASPGYLLVVRDGNLMATPFDTRKKQVTGEAVLIATGVRFDRSNAKGAFTASNDGTLVYAGGEIFLDATINWYDRAGNETAVSLAPAAYQSVRLAPDATHAAAAITAPSGDNEIWVLDLARSVSTRLASAAWTYDYPVWSGRSDRVMYGAQQAGGWDFYTRSADGSGVEQPVLVDGSDKVLYDWSRDGKSLVYWPIGAGSGTPDLWIYSVEEQSAEVLIDGEPTYTDARFSPDGRWIAYAADDTGDLEVFIQALGSEGDGQGPGGMQGGARVRVSTSGGDLPHWRDDGREIVYMDPDQRLMAVAVEVEQDRLALGTPRELFALERRIVTGDITGDHQRFLLATQDQVPSEPLHVILNWPAGLAP